MASKKVIANLSTLITANAVQFMDEFKRADNVARRYTSSISKLVSKPVGRISLGLLGAGGVAALVTRELRHVIENIEKIPGVPPAAVASVRDMKNEMSDLRAMVDRTLARAIAFGADFARAIGAGAAMLAGASGEDVHTGLMADAYKETPNSRAAREDPEFWNKVQAARAKLVETSKAAERASMTEGQRVAQLRIEEERYLQHAKAASLTTLQSLAAQQTATEKRTEANRLSLKIEKEYEEQVKKTAVAMAPFTGATVEGREAVELLRARLVQLQMQLAAIDDTSPAGVERRTEVLKEMAINAEKLDDILERQAFTARKAGEAITDSFEEAIFSGDKLGDVLEGLIVQLAKMALRDEFLRPIGSWIGSGIKRIMGFARGGRPMPGQPSMVGEEGPELFVPDVAGRVIPAAATAAALGGGRSSGGTYYIDARGADQAAIGRLERMIAALHGSVERRAVAAVLGAKRRGGGLGGALAFA